jgi:hypothetical protein
MVSTSSAARSVLPQPSARQWVLFFRKMADRALATSKPRGELTKA